ncbi:hypothetical protein PUR52_21245 [Ralstonia solanacearum]|nr:hypothetical protein [Ralstonia pseudosolanacearum]
MRRFIDSTSPKTSRAPAARAARTSIGHQQGEFGHAVLQHEAAIGDQLLAGAIGVGHADHQRQVIHIIDLRVGSEHLIGQVPAADQKTRIPRLGRQPVDQRGLQRRVLRQDGAHGGDRAVVHGPAIDPVGGVAVNGVEHAGPPHAMDRSGRNAGIASWLSELNPD